MRLKNLEISERIEVRLDKSMADDTSTGIITYGLENDYPQIIEKLLYGSQTAKAVSKIYGKFLAGSGFVDTTIGTIIVGHDIKGKEITLDSIRIDVAKNIARFNGVYLHANFNLKGEVSGDFSTSVLSFKDYRFSTKDSRGYCSRIAKHTNWSKKRNVTPVFNKADISWFNAFNPKQAIIDLQALKKGEKYKGQIYYYFLDDEYFYPLSPFDSVYLDMDTEFQMQLYKNRQIRNGFAKKTVMRVPPYANQDDKLIDETNFKKFLGADGDNALLLQCEVDENGEITNKDFKFETLETNIDADIFINWENTIPNNIRKAASGMPQILIDFDSGKQAPASGELLKTAFDSYNAYVKDERTQVSECLKNFFKYHENATLRNADFTINPIQL